MSVTVNTDLLEFSELSDEAQTLLIDIKECQIAGFDDDRGYYAEFDSFHCKPNSSNTIFELQDTNWAIFDIKSDKAEETSESPVDFFHEDEEQDEDGDGFEDHEEEGNSGVAFMSIPDQVLPLIPDL